MNISTFTNSFLKHLRYGERLNLARDWFVMVSFLLAALISIIIWNVWAFDTVASGGVIGNPATSTPAVFNQSSLDTVHAVFANRAIEEEKYENGTYHFADPSQ